MSDAPRSRLPLALGIANPGLLPLCVGDGLGNRYPYVFRCRCKARFSDLGQLRDHIEAGRNDKPRLITRRPRHADIDNLLPPEEET